MLEEEVEEEEVEEEEVQAGGSPTAPEDNAFLQRRW